MYGGAVGGFVAGFALGTNRYDGIVTGLRAGVDGVVVVAILAVVSFAVLWNAQSGALFLYWVPFYGAVGVLIRRWVISDHLNPKPSRRA